MIQYWKWTNGDAVECEICGRPISKLIDVRWRAQRNEHVRKWGYKKWSPWFVSRLCSAGCLGKWLLRKNSSVELDVRQKGWARKGRSGA
jgi:hypothetical protein